MKEAIRIFEKGSFVGLSSSNIYFLLGLGFSLAAPIGPVNMEMLKQALKSKFGWILGILTGIGAMSGDFFIATIILFVGSEFLSSLLANPLIYGALIGLNVSILGYIGISALTHKLTVNNNDKMSTDMSKGNHSSFVLEEEIDGTTHLERWSWVRQYVTGLGLVMTSPWSYFWWITFGPYIIKSGIPLATFEQRLIVTLFFISGIFIWIVLYCSVLGISNRFASPNVLRWITRLSALVILAFAVKILNDALCFLFNLGVCLF